MLLDVLRPEAGRTYLDLGCGEGRVMRALKESGAATHGVDVTPALARRAADSGPVVIGRLPDLGFLRDDSYDGAFCVLALEHIEDEGRFFAEAARAVRPGGVFALVINHPFRTAPGATPISDSDGETLWRPGDYFSRGHHPGAGGRGANAVPSSEHGQNPRVGGSRGLVFGAIRRGSPPRTGRPGRDSETAGLPLAPPTLRRRVRPTKTIGDTGPTRRLHLP